MVYNAIYIRSSFQDFLADITINPTFRFAVYGAEIFHPFGASPNRFQTLLGVLKNNERLLTSRNTVN
ncbi:hypothetical protein Barb6XT_02627 [Bacteroidales bacterium Barb6XT]|nr:hypothetical protein Barb6XT_02627 [Bacteroidales bacterium Barb6XT]